MVRKTLSVTGMSCDGCERTVENALTDLDGVSSADADNEAGTVEIVAAEEPSDDDVRGAIEEAGYDVTGTA